MDKYLQENSSYERLYGEYKKYGSLIVAVDFDDTVYDFHKKGYTYEKVAELIRRLYEANCYIIIYTGNEDTDFTSSYLREKDIPYHSINEDCPTYIANSNKQVRKLYANVYIDDRSGIIQVYNELNRLLDEILKKL